MKNYIYFEELDSTNLYAKRLAKEDAPDGTVIIAGRQSEGYGRMKRKFFSPDSCGLYMSIILRPTLPPRKCLYITTAAAVAAARAIEELSGKKTDIKWVNDIYIDGKKVSGILTEAAFTSDTEMEYAVLGIGVNLNAPKGGFDPSIRDIAGAVYEDETDPDMRFTLACRIIDIFYSYYKELEGKSFLAEYRKRCFIVGRTVKVISPNEEYHAGVTGIDDEFGLITEREGKTLTLYSGEVSIQV